MCTAQIFAHSKVDCKLVTVSVLVRLKAHGSLRITGSVNRLLSAVRRRYCRPALHHSHRPQPTPRTVSLKGPLAFAWMPQNGVHWQSAGAGLIDVFWHCRWPRSGLFRTRTIEVL